MLWTVVRRQQDHLHRHCLGICSNSLQMNYRKSKPPATLTHPWSKATSARAAARTVFCACILCDNFSFELAKHRGASPEEFEAYRVALRKVITAVVLSTCVLALRVKGRLCQVSNAGVNTTSGTRLNALLFLVNLEQPGFGAHTILVAFRVHFSDLGARFGKSTTIKAKASSSKL